MISIELVLVSLVSILVMKLCMFVVLAKNGGEQVSQLPHQIRVPVYICCDPWVL
jgi:hypothetical protein